MSEIQVMAPLAGRTLEAAPAAGRRAAWLLPVLGVLAIAISYARVTQMDFVYDDFSIVKGDRYIQSARYIPSYFTEHLWTNIMSAAKNYYRPSFLLWLLGNYTLFQERPLGWHLTNLMLHLGAALLVYFLALRLSRSRFAAFAAMLLFGLHPIQVETVSWVSGSTEVLGTFLALAAFLCYVRANEHPERRVAYVAGSAVLYAFAALAKETVLIYPGIVFLHEWLGRPASLRPPPPRPRREGFHAAMHEMAPFFFVGLGYLGMRLHVLGALGHHVVALTTRAWLLTVPYVLQCYVVNLVWPAGLSPFYDTTYVNYFSPVKVFLPLIVAVTAAVLLFAAVRKSPAGLLCTFWLLLPLLPVLDIRVFPRNEFVHDRYLYHPMIGLALLAAIAIAHFECAWEDAPGKKRALYASLLAIFAALSAVTFRQARYWENNFELYTRGVAVAPHNGFANGNLGAVLLEQGQWDDAMIHLDEALRDVPDLVSAQFDIGLAYYEKAMYPQAEAAFKRSVQLQPFDAGSHFFLGMTYDHTGRLAQALPEVRYAIRLKPEVPNYHFALGMLLRESGDAAGARAAFQGELRLNPQHAAALRELRNLDQPFAAAPEAPAK
jgi:tetratricopeptide (TPR) repeat protein